MKDKYDLAIEYLTKNPDEILDSWSMIAENETGFPLFQFATVSGEPGDFEYGCLTQIRNLDHPFHAETPELTEAIRADNRIPRTHRELAVEHLPVFAEWQRKLDRELNRVEDAQ